MGLTTQTGSCLCGGVRFEIRGRLTPIQLCHARRCQKATGSAFAAEVGCKAEAFHWLSGADLLSEYDAPFLGEPPAYRRTFCRVCGSPMPTVRPGSPWVVLLAGVLDEDPVVQAFRHVFLADRAHWFEINDDLQKFEHRPPVDQRLPTAPASAQAMRRSDR